MTKPICPLGRVMTPSMCVREQEIKNKQHHPLFHYLPLTPQTDRPNCPITALRVPVLANSLTRPSLLIPRRCLCGLAGLSVIATFLFFALTGHTEKESIISHQYCIQPPPPPPFFFCAE